MEKICIAARCTPSGSEPARRQRFRPLDAPDRETCVVHRSITNTPLQALVLMNDPTYVEASCKLAERMMKEGGPDADADRLCLPLATARQPEAQEVVILKRVYAAQLDFYRADPSAAEKLLKVGESRRDTSLDADWPHGQPSPASFLTWMRRSPEAEATPHQIDCRA